MKEMQFLQEEIFFRTNAITLTKSKDLLKKIKNSVVISNRKNTTFFNPYFECEKRSISKYCSQCYKDYKSVLPKEMNVQKKRDSKTNNLFLDSSKSKENQGGNEINNDHSIDQ